MSDDDAREYLDVVRRVLSRNGLSAVDTDIFNSLFSGGDGERLDGGKDSTAEQIDALVAGLEAAGAVRVAGDVVLYG